MGLSMIEFSTGVAAVSLSQVRQAADWLVELRIRAANTSRRDDVSEITGRIFGLLIVTVASSLQKVCRP